MPCPTLEHCSVGIKRIMGSLVLLGVVVPLVSVHVLADADADKDKEEEDDGEGEAEDDGVGVVVQILDGLLVNLRSPPGLRLLRPESARLDAAEVLCDDALWLGMDIVVGILLEVELQWDDLIELHPRNAADKALSHGVILTNVEIPNVVELSGSTGLE